VRGLFFAAERGRPLIELLGLDNVRQLVTRLLAELVQVVARLLALGRGLRHWHSQLAQRVARARVGHARVGH